MAQWRIEGKNDKAKQQRENRGGPGEKGLNPSTCCERCPEPSRRKKKTKMEKHLQDKFFYIWSRTRGGRRKERVEISRKVFGLYKLRRGGVISGDKANRDVS